MASNRKLTWFISVSEFESVKEVEKLPGGNLESVKESHFSKDSVARLPNQRGAYQLDVE